MNEEILREQPISEILSSDQGVVEQQNEIIAQDSQISNGSLQGKFKTVESMQNAYECLEKEFTKKCQRVKELEKAETEQNITPEYTKEDWQEKVENFFQTNSKANLYASEISDVLKTDKVIAKSENSLNLAYQKVLASKFKTNEELIKDENFLNNYILQNSEVKEKVFQEYLSNLLNKKSVPLMMQNKGSNFTVVASSKPKSLKEAKKFAEALIKN